MHRADNVLFAHGRGIVHVTKDCERRPALRGHSTAALRSTQQCSCVVVLHARSRAYLCGDLLTPRGQYQRQSWGEKGYRWRRAQEKEDMRPLLKCFTFCAQGGRRAREERHAILVGRKALATALATARWWADARHVVSRRTSAWRTRPTRSRKVRRSWSRRHRRQTRRHRRHRSPPQREPSGAVSGGHQGPVR